jgi:serine/threonine-protein kinase
MEYIDGETLDGLRSLPWTSTQVSGFLATLLGYLQQLHDAGIVHRDIKPLNIKRADRGYVILDFGISTQNTHTLVSAHSPDFAAPEQLYDRREAGVHVDARTDLYCLAATAYYLLTNAKPTRAVMRLEGVTLRFSEQFDKAPSALQQTLLAMLALDIDKRPAAGASAAA